VDERRTFRTKSGDDINYRTAKDGAWLMNKKLAHALVDEGECFSVPLWSGMQTPLLTAVIYLEETFDRESIPRLRKLLAMYMPHLTAEKSDEPTIAIPWCLSSEEGKCVQAATVECLLNLLPLKESMQLAQQILRPEAALHLSGRTITVIKKYALKHEIQLLYRSLFNLGMEIKKQFDRRATAFKAGQSMGIAYEKLYGYEDLVYTAYQLARNTKDKEESLNALVAEYNHPDGLSKHLMSSRSHDVIDMIICEIVEVGLANQPEDRKSLIVRLSPDIFEHDLERYRRIMNREG